MRVHDGDFFFRFFFVHFSAFVTSNKWLWRGWRRWSVAFIRSLTHKMSGQSCRSLIPDNVYRSRCFVSHSSIKSRYPYYMQCSDSCNRVHTIINEWHEESATEQKWKKKSTKCRSDTSISSVLLQHLQPPSIRCHFFGQLIRLVLSLHFIPFYD